MAQPIIITGAGGEYMESVTVVAWRKSTGERVKAGEVLVVVETAKAATEIAAPCDGVLSKVLASAGEEIKVGAVLGLVGTTADDTGTEAGASAGPARAASGVASPTIARKAIDGRILASPAARKTASALGLDLARVTASSIHGRIKLRDLVAVTPRPAIGHPSHLHLERAGPADGTPLVLLHGFGADTNTWRLLGQQLGASSPRIAIDLPCHGCSPLAGFDSIEAAAEQVAATLAAHGIGPCDLAGHSLGGAVASALAAGQRACVRSLTLIAPVGLGPATGLTMLHELAAAATREEIERLLPHLVAEPALLPRGFAEAAAKLRSGTGLRQAQAALLERLFAGGAPRFDTAASLGRVGCPVSIVWGRQDRVLAASQALAAPATASLHLLPGIGHMPHVECPALLARLLMLTTGSPAHR